MFYRKVDFNSTKLLNNFLKKLEISFERATNKNPIILVDFYLFKNYSFLYSPITIDVKEWCIISERFQKEGTLLVKKIVFSYSKITK